MIADGVAEPGAGTGLPIMKLLPLRDRVEAACPPCREYVEPYNSHRPHRSLDQHPPAVPHIPRPQRGPPPDDETGSAAFCMSTCTSHDVTGFLGTHTSGSRACAS